MLVVATAFWFIKGRKTFLQTEDGIERIILARRMEADEV
jgi:hypothetical protein